jgi:hypothetical protein
MVNSYICTYPESSERSNNILVSLSVTKKSLFILFNDNKLLH